MAVVYSDGFTVFDLGSKEVVRDVRGMRPGPSVVVFSVDGRRVACGHRNGRVEVREVATGEVVHELGRNGDAVDALDFDADGGHLRVTRRETIVWNLVTGDVAQSPSSRKARADATDMTSDEVMKLLDPDPDPGADAMGALIANLVVSQVFQGGVVQCTSRDWKVGLRLSIHRSPPSRRSVPTKKAAIVDLGTGKTRYDLEASAPIACGDLSADGRWVVLGLEDGKIEWFDAGTGERVRVQEHGAGLEYVELSGDGSVLLTASGEPTGETTIGDRVRLWNGHAGILLTELDLHAEGVARVMVAESGDWFAVKTRGDRIIAFPTDPVTFARRLSLDPSE